MIRSFTIINHLGDSIFIDIKKPESTGFLISSVTGLDPVKSIVSNSEIGFLDGSFYNGSRLDSRNIVFNIIFFQDNIENLDIEQLRHKCYDYFPVKKEITIKCVNDSGEYQIKGYVETNEIPIFTKEEGTQVSIICPDPYFELTEEDSLHYISAVVPNFSFPVSFEAVIVDKPDEEFQPGLYYMQDADGNYYYEYSGPYSVTSKAFNSQVLDTAFKFSKHQITVNPIPYSEEPNESGGTTIKIGGPDASS